MCPVFASLLDGRGSCRDEQGVVPALRRLTATWEGMKCTITTGDGHRHETVGIPRRGRFLLAKWGWECREAGDREGFVEERAVDSSFKRCIRQGL